MMMIQNTPHDDVHTLFPGSSRSRRSVAASIECAILLIYLARVWIGRVSAVGGRGRRIM